MIDEALEAIEQMEDKEAIKKAKKLKLKFNGTAKDARLAMIDDLSSEV